MSESQTHTDGGVTTSGATGNVNPGAGASSAPMETDRGVSPAPDPDANDDVPVTSAAEQETADAARLDQATNGDNATDHAADGQPTAADNQR